MENFNNYKFRCSSLGKIISKSGKFTETTKTYLNEIFIQETEGVRKEITSKYFEKGKFQEEDGITMLQNTLHKKDLILKNTERKSNDFIHGECDCFTNGIIYDIKNAWDRFTFGKAELSHEYEWQIRGYIYLWQASQGRLFYCLNNTPDHILQSEYKKIYWQNGFQDESDEEYVNLCMELKDAHNYDSKPLHERFKMWDVQLSADNIDEINEAVINARIYLNQLLKERTERYENNLKLML